MNQVHRIIYLIEQLSKKNRDTSTVRIVLDGSSKQKHQPALNEAFCDLFSLANLIRSETCHTKIQKFLPLI